MKWVRKKTTSRASLISQVLPTSWLTKFKQMSINPRQEHAKLEQKGKWSYVSASSLQFADGEGRGRFYGGDGDAFWRLSFGDEESTGALRSFHYDLDYEPEAPPSSCHSCRSDAARVKYRKADSFVSGNVQVSEEIRSNAARVNNRKIRGLPREVEILPEMDTCTREKVAEITTPRLKVERNKKKLRKTSQRVSKEQQWKLHGEPCVAEMTPGKETSKNIFEMESKRTIGMIEREDSKLTAPFPSMSPIDATDSSRSKAQEDDFISAVLTENDRSCSDHLGAEWKKLEDVKIEELKSRSGKQRKSLHISGELQRKKSNSKARVYSPRTAVCRIKALGDMKKAKLKMKEKEREKISEEGFTNLESFAVVKCSFDPQKDFRDSMLEMIEEKRISRPEELEELLACYLTLNADEYHDLIIKVFRQVWFDMNQACLDTDTSYLINNVIHR